MRLRLTETAEGDLAEIAAWLSQEASEETARRIIRDLLMRLDDLVSFPESGVPRDHLRPGLRAVFRRKYVMYYRIEKDFIAVVRVLHGARDVSEIAEAGGFQA
jgi:toxin ParE1/3/4